MLGNIGETFELLFDKNNNVAYKALQELQKESEETDCVYPFIDKLSDMLDSDNSYIRTRGLTLLAYNKFSTDIGTCRLRPPVRFLIIFSTKRPEYRLVIILYFL